MSPDLVSLLITGVTAFRGLGRKVKRLLKMFKNGILRSRKLILISGNSFQSLANIALCAVGLSMLDKQGFEFLIVP